MSAANGSDEFKASKEIFRFDDFELDRGTFELRRAGQPVPLQRLPFELLYLLIECRGQLVTRHQIIERLWGKTVFVDSENGINTAVNKIRRALNDDADEPRFVVTVPAKGYRFVAAMSLPNGESSGLHLSQSAINGDELETAELPAEAGDAAARIGVEKQPVGKKYWRNVLLSVGLVLMVAAAVLALHFGLRPPASPALPLPDQPSIAVLPFTNMSGDRQQEYFSDGITDDLITALSRIPNLFVIARTSSFTYKGKAATVQEVSRELGVKYILEGSVHKASDQIRITAQLVDATTGADLWAQHYDRPLKDIFALQDEIVQRIVTTLNLQLAVSEHGILITKRTENLEAYDYFLRGVEFFTFGSPTKEPLEKARQMFEKAIELDSRYSDAYAQLGSVLLVGQTSQWSHDPDGVDRTIKLEQQSIALDNSNAFAYAIMSFAYTLKRQYDLGITDAERALAFDPNSKDGYASMANALAYSGKPAEAVVAAQKAMRLDPRRRDFYSLFEGFSYMLMGSYERAIPLVKTYLASYPNFIPGHLDLIVCYVELGRNEEARAEAAEVMRINPEFSLAAQERISPLKEPLRERNYGDMAKAGLK